LRGAKRLSAPRNTFVGTSASCSSTVAGSGAATATAGISKPLSLARPCGAMICRAFDPPSAFFFCAPPLLLLSTVDHSPSGLGSSFVGEALRAEPRSARSARAARQPRTAQRSAGRGIAERLVWTKTPKEKSLSIKASEAPETQLHARDRNDRRDAAHSRQLRPADQGSLAACGMQPVPVLAIFLHFALPAGRVHIRGRRRAAENASRRRADERLGRRAGFREGRVRARGLQGDGGCN